jgi:cellulose synthase/poly-beta-1,6-N-acetylglucosamine synthase-like glycosyltransferase
MAQVVQHDTLANLPAITRPMPALMGSELSRSGHSWSITDGERWAKWGAASDGARTTLTFGQWCVLALLGGTLLGLFAVSTHVLGVVCVALTTAVYLVAGIYKCLLLLRGERAVGTITVDPSSIADKDLPLYTVLVPLFHEAKFLPVLVDQLVTIDYPLESLEILFLVEADDNETREALRASALPSHMRTVVVPPGQPRTKPRALNVGLAWARGEYVVVYDAEDRPEHDQLRKAVAAFRELPRRVVCLQARLNFYNRHQTLVTRLFSVDYTVWYGMFLPGLVHKRAFVPLGGTSNHFRVSLLRRLGGWDPFNVTEDADLGARIARAGLEIMMLDSVTWEEAVAGVRPWVRQRSRWIKGYMQTYLVHMRHPLRLLRQIGPRAFLDFQLLLGGTAFILLVNPLMWMLTVTYFATKGTSVGTVIESLYPVPVYYPALLCLLANFAFLYVQLYVCMRRDYDDLARYTLLGPLYWILMSVGAWRALASLVRSPSYWAKTEHGVSLGAIAATPVAREERKLMEISPVEPMVLSPAITTTRSMSVILPAHNEEAVIAKTVSSVLETLSYWDLEFEVIVVNDGSTDHTHSIVEARAAADPRVHLVDHTVNQGYGAALVSGFAAATKELTFFMDADGQFDIRDLARFLPLIERYDAVLGYRVDRKDAWMRRLYARGWKLAVGMVLGVHARDIDCAFKLFHSTLFRQQVLESRGALINAEILDKLTRAGCVYTQVGVQHLPRQGGRATGAKPSVIARAFKELLVYAWMSRVIGGNSKQRTLSTAR